MLIIVEYGMDYGLHKMSFSAYENIYAKLYNINAKTQENCVLMTEKKLN